MRVYLRRTGDTFTADVAELPACSVRGATRDEALERARAAVGDYREILRRHGVSMEHLATMDPERVEVTEVAEDTDAGIVPTDLLPVQEHDLRDFLHELEGLRAEVLALVGPLDAEAIERRPREGMWSVREAMEHIAQVQVQYLGRMERWPASGGYPTFQAVHRMIAQRFSVLEASEATFDHRIQDRRWTIRRVMRKLLGHEYEHLRHIREILAAR